MDRKVANLDHKYDIGQAVRTIVRLRVVQMSDTSLDAVVSHRSVVKQDRAAFGHHIDAKSEIRENGFVRVLAVDKTNVDPGVDLPGVKIFRAALKCGYFPCIGDLRQI